MSETDRSVFISYRRSTSKHLARAIFMDLRAHGYDVFMDVDTIDSGEFDRIILNQIAARPHFLLLLTPGALDRCNEPEDWLRREVEQAIELNRNIVPIIEEGFNFKDVEPYLTGKLVQLPHYNAVLLYHAYFDAALDNLRNRFLKQPTYDIVLSPVSAVEQTAVQQQIEETENDASLTPKQLEARKYFNRAVRCQINQDFSGAILDYSETIRLNPMHHRAYLNRGAVKSEIGDYAAAILDFGQAIRLNPKNALAYNMRGWAQFKRGKIELALEDYNLALQLDPKLDAAYCNRGWVHYRQDNFEAAITDHTKALEFNPKNANFWDARASAYYHAGDYAKAIADWNGMIDLEPDNYAAYNNRAEAYFAYGEYELALNDFQKADKLKSGYELVMSGLAITFYKLGQHRKAQNLWKQLLKHDSNYRDIKWVQQKNLWVEPLAEQARELIASL